MWLSVQNLDQMFKPVVHLSLTGPYSVQKTILTMTVWQYVISFYKDHDVIPKSVVKVIMGTLNCIWSISGLL